jgi:type I restriction enzyme S subunit
MKIKAVPFSWIRRWGLRLDTSPYMGGAVEARVALDKIRFKKEPLKTLTSGHNGGIYNGPMFRRNYVDSAAHGVPFLTSGSMLKADLSDLSFLRRKDAESNKLSFLQLTAGTTMISCSGTIGRMVYARPDMESMWASQDILKVVPDKSRIPSGYLHAFLTGKFGVPLITSGTYGAIIQHIEPEHIADLPVPRLGDAVEKKTNELVEMAAKLRGKASTSRAEAIAIASSIINWKGMPERHLNTKVKASQLERRMDAFHHSFAVSESRKALTSHADSESIGSRVESVFEPNRGARRKVDDPAFGVPFLSSSEVFRLDPQGEYLISRKNTPHLETLIVTKRDLLIPRSGQIGGIIGRAVMPLPTYYDHAASEHLVRIRCRSYDDACYLWAILASEPGYWAAVGTAFGSSIPSLDTELLSSLSVPFVKGKQRTSIIELVNDSVTKQSEAIHAERQAVEIVEKAIEEAA